MGTILGQLREGDTFNMVTFESRITTWRPGRMLPGTLNKIKSAQAFAQNLLATGGKKNYKEGNSLHFCFRIKENKCLCEKPNIS